MLVSCGVKVVTRVGCFCKCSFIKTWFIYCTFPIVVEWGVKKYEVYVCRKDMHMNLIV